MKTSSFLLFVSAVTLLEVRGDRTVETAWSTFDRKQRDLEFSEGDHGRCCLLVCDVM